MQIVTLLHYQYKEVFRVIQLGKANRDYFFLNSSVSHFSLAIVQMF
jgi:hypothetical protein